MVEMAGIEPASAQTSDRASSTCVSSSYQFSGNGSRTRNAFRALFTLCYPRRPPDDSADAQPLRMTLSMIAASSNRGWPL